MGGARGLWQFCAAGGVGAVGWVRSGGMGEAFNKTPPNHISASIDPREDQQLTSRQ